MSQQLAKLERQAGLPLVDRGPGRVELTAAGRILARAGVLTEDEYRVAVPSAWGAPADAAELSGRPWISAPLSSARGRCFRRFADRHGIVPSVEHLAVSPHSQEAMAATRSGWSTARSWCRS